MYTMKVFTQYLSMINFQNKTQLTVDVPARIFIPSAEKSTAVTGPSCSEN